MKIVFLDRDGVINKYPGDKKYVTKWKDFHFLPGAKEGIALLHKNGFRLFIVSNQAGVGRRIYSQKKLNLITRNMLKLVRNSGGDIDGVYYCTHPKEDNCACRKPRTGSVKRARKDHRLNIRSAFFIGDTMRDIHTAKSARIKSILVLSGKEKLSGRKNWEAKPDFVFKDLYQAAKFITNNK